MKPSILVAQAEAPGATFRPAHDLVQALSLEGFAPIGVDSASDVLHHLDTSEQPDLLLLDRNLADEDGLELCRRLRQDTWTRHLPIVLTARDPDTQTRIASLEAGADDFLPRPFSRRELVLRLRAVLRRAGNHAQGPRTLQTGRLRLDLEREQAWVDDQSCDLTDLEFQLLATFARQPGRVLSRQDLLQEAWPETDRLTARVVDVRVMLLRRKLPHGDRFIETVRGVGYRLKT